ncbi:MAG: hypothetical protein R3213_04595 [Flavobacteriaceae bacterium]|nr:hypothetical protein [Flavobacteriaceae bacterium]
MKNLISILALTMVTFLGYSQDLDKDENTIELEDVVMSLNRDYLVLVQDAMTPPEVARLQLKAANYDVRKHPEFSEDVETDVFEMAFRNSKGAIHAFYDNQGKIESAFERFHDVVLPREVLLEILNSYKGYNMVSNLYVSSYDQKKDNLNRSYKIDLENGINKRTVKIDPPK